MSRIGEFVIRGTLTGRFRYDDNLSKYLPTSPDDPFADNNTRRKTMDTFTELNGFTALCIYENVLTEPNLEWMNENPTEGVCGVRQTILNLAQRIDHAYNIISDFYLDPFDMEFVPAVLAKLDESNMDTQIGINEVVDEVVSDWLNEYSETLLAEYNEVKNALWYVGNNPAQSNV